MVPKLFIVILCVTKGEVFTLTERLMVLGGTWASNRCWQKLHHTRLEPMEQYGKNCDAVASTHSNIGTKTMFSGPLRGMRSGSKRLTMISPLTHRASPVFGKASTCQASAYCTLMVCFDTSFNPKTTGGSLICTGCGRA